MKHPVDTSQWGDFVVGELFELTGIKQVKSQHHVVEDPNGIPFVVQSNKNNMVKMKADKQWLIDNDEPVVEGNAIVLGVTLPVVSYQPYEFGASQVITARSEHLNELRGLFITSVINSFVIPKYSYVYKPGIQKYKQDVIPLPLKPSADPSNYDQTDIDWDYMETVMSRVTARAKERLANLPQPTDKKKTPVDTSSWGEFVVGELFDVQLSDGDNKPKKLPKGNIPLVSAGNTNNGIVGLFESDTIIFPAHSITVDMFGQAFYQPKKFQAVSHGRVNILVPNFETNENIGRFIVTILNAQCQKYSFTEMLTSKKIKAESIKLPLKPSADPSNYTQDDIDWEYMDRFMQAIKEKAHERVASLKEQI